MRLPLVPRGLRAAVPVAVGFVVAGGCKKTDPVRYDVGGTVSYQGAHLTTGEVAFHPPAGPPSRAVIGKDGTYRLSEALPGPYAVTVTTPAKPTNGKPYKGPANRPTPVFTPAKFARKESSGLNFVVSDTSVRYDIQLAD